MKEHNASYGRVAMIVANSIDGDSRVQKSARTLSAAGWDVHLIGASRSGRYERSSIGDVEVYRLPVPRLAVKKWAESYLKVRHPLALSSQEAAEARHRIRLNWIDLEERKAASSSRVSRVISPSYLSARVRGKFYRRWLSQRAKSTRQYEKARKSATTTGTQSRLEELEVILCRMLHPKSFWRRLDPTNNRFELAFRSKILELEPDVIHAHDIRPLGVAVRCANNLKLQGKDVAVVYDAHECIHGLDDFPSRLRTALEGYERHYIRHVDEVVTVAPALADMLQERYALAKKPQVVLNTPLADTGTSTVESLEHADVRAACGIGPDTPLAVYAGAAASDRYLECLIEAVVHVPDLHLALMLNNLELKYTRELAELAKALDVSDRVSLLPYVPVDAITAYLRTADIGVISLAGEKTNHLIALSTKLFEYVQAGLPLVGPAIGASKEFIEQHRNGALYTPRNPASIAAAMRSVIDEKDRYTSAYEEPERFETYIWEHQAKTYLDLYAQLLSRTRRSGPSESEWTSTGRLGPHERLESDAHIAIALMQADHLQMQSLVALLKQYPLLAVDVLDSVRQHDRIINELNKQGVGDRVRVVDPRETLESGPSRYGAVLVIGEEEGQDPLQVPRCLTDFFQAGVPLVVGGNHRLEQLAIDKKIGLGFNAHSPQDFARALGTALTQPSNTKVFAERRRFGTATPWTQTKGNPTRVWMGTANCAGQLTGIASALSRSRLDVSSHVTARIQPNSKIQYAADRTFTGRSQQLLSVRFELAEQVLDWSTHVIADAFLPVFGGLNGPDIEADLPALRTAGKRIALLAHGSEIRSPERHLAKHPDSLFNDASADLLKQLKEITARNAQIARDCGLPIYVTTPDLLDDLPEATWMPLIVDADRWSNDYAVMERSIPRVVHAPSKRWTKGTEKVLPYLERLDSSGVIDFRLLEGLAPSAVHETVVEADIVVDQFSIGAYGTFACEAMAAGKPVLAYLSADLPEAIGSKPPIVNCTADTLPAAMEMLFDDRDMARQLGSESVGFVQTYHNGEMAVRQLSGFLEPLAQD